MTKLRMIGLAAAALLLLQCGDDSGSPTDPKTYDRTDGGGGSGGGGGGAAKDAGTPAANTNADQFLNDYASAVCAVYKPCCESADLGFDAAGCTTWYRKVTAAYFNGTFRPQPAAECLRELASVRAADDLRCKNVLSFDAATLRDSCRLAFNATDHGGAALGESCKLSGDCASDPSSPVICLGSRCMLEKRGQENDGPCYINRRAEGEQKPTVIVECGTTDNLYCDLSLSVCKPLLNDGDRCPNNAGCKAGSTCNGGVCVALPGPGERCLNAVPGAGGFCRPQSACDHTTLVCGAALQQGASCREPNECESGSCMGNLCTKPEFTRALNCTGKNTDQ
jgi:hypothetical protein